MANSKVLEAVATHCAPLLTGYEIKFFRWTDAEMRDKQFVCFSAPGTGGDSNVLLQSQDVMLTMVSFPANALSGNNTMSDIQRLFRENGTSGGVVRFEPIGFLSSPFYLEDGRAVMQLNVRVYTEDQ